MAKEVIITADKIKKRRKFSKIVKISLLILLLLLIVIYILLQANYSRGSFSVSLGDNDSLEAGLTLYESMYDTTPKTKLYATNIQFMDNISVKWLPADIDSSGLEGSHNGENYIAYSFYVENRGKDVINYWYSMIVDNVIKNVDEAVRIEIFLNGNSQIYAKKNPLTQTAEKDTQMFREDNDGTIILEQRKNFNPGDIDRFTVVVWIEGDDPECVNELIGGMMEMHMSITEEHMKE